MKRFLVLLCCMNVCWGTVLKESSKSVGAVGGTLIQNGDFENGTEGWNPVWAREPGAAKAVLDDAGPHAEPDPSASSTRARRTGASHDRAT